MNAAKLATVAHADVAPDHIMQVGMGFWASKVLLSAVELGVFAHLGDGPKTGRQLERDMALHPRGTSDFLDALVALGFLVLRWRRHSPPLPQYRRNGDVSRSQQSAIHRWHPRNGECTALSLLGRPHAGPENGRSAE